MIQLSPLARATPHNAHNFLGHIRGAHLRPSNLGSYKRYKEFVRHITLSPSKHPILAEVNIYRVIQVATVEGPHPVRIHFTHTYTLSVYLHTYVYTYIVFQRWYRSFHYCEHIFTNECRNRKYQKKNSIAVTLYLWLIYFSWKLLYVF